MSFDIKFTWLGFENATDSTCILEAEPGKLDIKKTGTWYSIYQFTSWFTLQTSDYDVNIYFPVDLTSLMTSYKKCNVIMT